MGSGKYLQKNQTRVKVWSTQLHCNGEELKTVSQMQSMIAKEITHLFITFLEYK